MIYKFRLVSDEVDNFKREIEIDADSTFIKLRDAIDKAVDYEPSPMCSFFICEDGWEKGQEITLEDMGLDSASDTYLMDDTVISDMVEDRGQRLIFVFDYLTDRSFFLELKETRPGEYLDEAVCTVKRGTPPPQHIDLEDFEEKIDAKAAADAKKAAETDLDADFYGNDGYNDDEFDAAGFDEMTFDDMR